MSLPFGFADLTARYFIFSGQFILVFLLFFFPFTSLLHSDRNLYWVYGTGADRQLKIFYLQWFTTIYLEYLRNSVSGQFYREFCA